MKTLVDIDESLLKKAMALSGAKTKKATIHNALEELIKARQRDELMSLQGSDFLDMSLEEWRATRRKRGTKHAKL